MDSGAFDVYLRYALGVCGLIFLIALWGVRRRGAAGLFMAGGVAGFGLLLYLLTIHAPEFWLYVVGFVVALCLVVDFFARTSAPRDDPRKQ